MREQKQLMMLRNIHHFVHIQCFRTSQASGAIKAVKVHKGLAALSNQVGGSSVAFHLPE